MSTDSQPTTQSSWDFRFAFFDAHGAPNSPTYKEAFKKLEWGERVKMGMNFWAFFFGPFYLLYLGLWKKAIVYFVLMLSVVFALAVLGAPDILFRGFFFAFAAVIGMMTNYAYYLKKVKNQDGWNPFEGIRWV